MLTGKQGRCQYTGIFYGFPLTGKSAKLLVGARPPKPVTSGQVGPKSALCTCCLRSPSLPLLFLVFLRVRQAEQMIYIALSRNNLLHIFSYRTVLLVRGPFRRRQLLVFLYERVHLRELRPGQNALEGERRR